MLVSNIAICLSALMKYDYVVSCTKEVYVNNNNTIIIIIIIVWKECVIKWKEIIINVMSEFQNI